MRRALIAPCALVLLLAACDGGNAPPAPKDTSKKQAATEPTSGPASGPSSGPSSGPASAPAPAAPEKLEGTGVEKRFNFKIVLKPEKPPLNALFEAETIVTDAKTGEPVTGLTVSLDATMPEHRHGMMTEPVHKEIGEGRYATEGMKLHMPGSWEFHATAKKPEGDDDHFKVRYNQPAKAAE